MNVVACARFISIVIAVWRSKAAQSDQVKYWEFVADNLSKPGWSWGSPLDSKGGTIRIVDAHRGDGKRFVGTLRNREKCSIIERLVVQQSFACLSQTNEGGPITGLPGYYTKV